MGKKSQKAGSSSLIQFDPGTERKNRIANWRAKMQLEGTRIRNYDMAINSLLDKALDLEKV